MFQRTNSNRVDESQLPILLSEAVENGNAQTLRELVKNLGSNRQSLLDRALADAVGKRALEMITILLEAGANPDAYSHYPYNARESRPFLNIAAINADYHIAEKLVQHGASITRALKCAQDEYQSIIFDKQNIFGKLVYQDVRQSFLNELSGLIQEYQRVIHVLLDFAMGTDIHDSDEMTDPQPRGLTFLTQMDVTKMNFVGLSVNGIPVSREMLEKHNVLWLDNALLSEDDWRRTFRSAELAKSNEPRHYTLNKRLQGMQALRGKLVNASGVVDVAPLFASVRAGNLAAVQARLNAGVDPNETSPDGSVVPIIVAAEKGHKEIVAVLLACTNGPIRQNTLIKALAKTSNKDIAAQLKKHVAVNHVVDEDQNSSLHHAAMKDDVKEIEMLLSLGASSSLKNKWGESPLHIAVKHGGLAAVKLLVSKELLSDVNSDYFYFLCQYRNAKPNETAGIITFLLNKCDEWKIKVDTLRIADQFLDRENLDAFKVLLPRIEKQDGWDIRLMRKALFQRSYMDTLPLLKQHGADINRVDQEDGTLVTMAVNRAISSLAFGANYKERMQDSLRDLHTVSEMRLRFLFRMGACFADDKSKSALIKKIKSTLELYGSGCAQSYIALLNEIGVQSPRQTLSRRLG